MNGKQVLTEKEVQGEFGFSIPYLRRARREKRGPRFLKIGKLVRYTRADLEAFLAAHAVPTSNLGGTERRVDAR